MSGELFADQADPAVTLEMYAAHYGTPASQEGLQVPVAALLTAFSKVEDELPFGLSALFAALGVQRPT